MTKAKNTKKQINQHYLLEEIMKHEILVALLIIVDEIISDTQITSEDIIESIINIIIRNDLSGGDLRKIWTDCL